MLEYDESNRQTWFEMLNASSKETLLVAVAFILGIISLSVLAEKQEELLDPVFHGLINDKIVNVDYAFSITDITEENLNYMVNISFIEPEETATFPQVFLICSGNPSIPALQTNISYEPSTLMNESLETISFLLEEPCETVLFIKIEDVRSGSFKWIRI